jgi:hypothetical protein
MEIRELQGKRGGSAAWMLSVVKRKIQFIAGICNTARASMATII